MKLKRVCYSRNTWEYRTWKMLLHLTKIISGGQTGADLGGLRAAHELGLETGGTAPREWLTEDGPQEVLLRGFGLTECDTEGYAARTRQNIELSDGTLLVGPYRSGGSRLTHEIAMQLKKPLFHVAYTTPPEMHEQRLAEFRYWLERHGIQTLNIAGNRESTSPGIEDFTLRFLLEALQRQS